MGEYNLACKSCGKTKFSFTWKWKSINQYNRMYLLHDGMGLQLEDAYIKCESCGKIIEPDNKYED